ncbi:MAG: hypothetical protein JNK64_11280 [Myxococcales bacterium]|nr:hypothetical protein [Myxococcales bacterium]
MLALVVTRNSKSVMATIFSRLSREVVRAGLEHACASPVAESRWILGGADDQDALQRAIVLSAFVEGQGVVSVLLEWRGKNYLVTTCGVAIAAVADLPSATPWLAGPFGNAGIAALAMGELEWPLRKVDAAEYVERIFFKSGAYDLNEMLPFFAPVKIWELRVGIEAGYRYSRLIAMSLVLAYAANELPIRARPDLAEELARAADGAAGDVAGEQLWRVATSLSARHQYLELYRSLEALFRIPYVESMARRHSRPLREYDMEVENALGWHPKGVEALVRLFSVLAEQVFDVARVRIGMKDGSRDSIANSIASTRHKIAHLRLSQIGDVGNLEREADARLGAMIYLVHEVHSAHHVAIGDYVNGR